MAMKRLVLCLCLLAVPFWAAELDANSLVLQMAKEILSGTQNSRKMVESMRGLHPRGPDFFSQFLSILLKDPSPWTSYSDPRRSLLYVLEDSASNDTGTWNGFSESPLHPEIRRQMQELLVRSPQRTIQQDIVANLFSILKLWDLETLPFLVRRIVSGNVEYVSRLAEVMAVVSPEVQTEVFWKLSKQRDRLVVMTELLILGVLPSSEYESLFRVRIEGIKEYTTEYLSSDFFIRDREREQERHGRVDDALALLLRKKDPEFLHIFEMYRDHKKLFLNTSYRGRKIYQSRSVDAYMAKLWQASTPEFPKDSNVISLYQRRCNDKLR